MKNGIQPRVVDFYQAVSQLAVYFIYLFIICHHFHSTS